MGIFKKLGLSLTPKGKEDKPFEIHPLARVCHRGALVAWAMGDTIEALHPTDGWVVVDRPIFEPDTQYRAVSSTIWQGDSKPSLDSPFRVSHKYTDPNPFVHLGNDAPPPPPPMPTYVGAPVVVQKTTRFQRGEVWKAANGHKYLVLGNKYDIVLNDKYDVAKDPDKYPLILVRWDEGMKKSLTHRDLFGRRVAAPNENLVSKVDFIQLEPIPSHGIVFKRGKDKLIVNFQTGETVVRPI